MNYEEALQVIKLLARYYMIHRNDIIQPLEEKEISDAIKAMERAIGRKRHKL